MSLLKNKLTFHLNNTMEKLYWQSLENYNEQKNNSVTDKNEPIPEFSIEGLDESEIKGKSSRRDFLKLLGFFGKCSSPCF